ncbi:hypothetical protein GAYE_SCF07G2951 [Galdieria yellowstonensis]|uniref:RNA-binding protein n=1 Tax=Galdieria yellowstonensis TaxID=3028027 RepID=A0AAV9ICP8_9RHOD|nr:hypothetical protein GAYE_SCF07G2951 [Galdieria yellowstonensis]
MLGGNTQGAEQVGPTPPPPHFHTETSQVGSLQGSKEGFIDGKEGRADTSTTYSKRQDFGIPSNTIIVREIPNPVDSNHLKQFFNSSFGPVRDVRIPQSQFSINSKSYGFVEFVRVETAKKVIEKAVDDSIIYQGAKLDVSFASDGTGGKGWDCLACGYANFARRRVCKKCGAKKEINDILGSSQKKVIAGDAVLAARWTASSQGLTDQSPYAKYCLDPTSGWYYDPQTLYYVVDAFQLVFYDWSRQIYLQYIPATGTYVECGTNTVAPPNPTCGDATAAACPSAEPNASAERATRTDSVETTGDSGTKSDGTNSTEQTSEKERKVSEPQSITKSKITVTPLKPRGRTLSNIQRWNQRRVERQELFQESDEEEEREQIEQKDEQEQNVDAKTPTQLSGDSHLSVGNQNVGGDEPAENESNAEKHSETANDATEQVFICELCRRKFKSNDILEKHIQFSQLHQTNLQKQSSVYRDRAAERRQLYPPEDNEDDNDSNNLRKKNNSWRPKKRRPVSDKVVHEPLDMNNNIGAKLMKSMGWREGQGLGRDASGITAPISAITNRGQSGLGSEPLNDPELIIHPTDSQKERLRKETLLRWKMKFGNIPTNP